MPYCEYCGEEIGYLPFKCKYCGGTFCEKDRLPENHECTFELKHKSVVSITPREPRPLYQEDSENDIDTRDYFEREAIEQKKRLKKQEKQKKRAIKIHARTYGGVQNYNGTKFLIGMIIILSIISLIFDYIGMSQYIYLSLNGIIYEFSFYTIITALFIAPAGGIFGIFILFIMIYFLYGISKSIELQHGTKFLLKLYVFCCLFSGLFYVLLRLLLHLFYPINLYPVYVGLAWGGLYGIIAFLIFPIMNREITSLVYFIPIKMKGKTFLIVLVLIRLIPGLIYAFISPLYVVIYLPDLGGILGAYILYKYRFLKR